MALAPRLAAALLAALVLPAAAFAGGSAATWANPEIALVTRDGLFSATPATFDGGAPLTHAALGDALTRLGGPAAVRPTDGSAPVSLEELDRSLVDALGLADSASRFRSAAGAAGLAPPTSFGTEVVARLLGLRLDHPARDDDLELRPGQTATRAEAAYSLAQILRFDGATAAPSPAVERLRAAAASFQLPPLSVWQRRILSTALSYVGYPYVWGGTGGTSTGFDCSGFVWRVYKLTAYPDDGALAGVLRGRTTTAMSGEVSRSQRIPADALEPGDVMFFGRGPRSKPAQVDHAAIYLGNGWLVQSAGQGVALAPFDGWYRSSFAWARRPLAEAELD
jgi:cell wall-associated NlpC family hydrolase